MTSFSIVHELSEDRWRHFVDEHPRGTIFHTPEMFQVFARVQGHHPEVWAATEGDSILALMIPLQIILRSGLLGPLTTRSVVYGSVLSAPGIDGRKALMELLQAYVQGVRGHSLFTELRNVSDNSDIQPALNKCGFALEGHLNYLINLNQSEEIIWQNIGKSVRKHIRTSEKKGIEIIDLTERDLLPQIGPGIIGETRAKGAKMGWS